jgi:hypothetical protein
MRENIIEGQSGVRLGWNRAEDGVITVYAHSGDGRVADVADFWLGPMIERFGMTRDAAKEWQQRFAEMLVEKHNEFFREFHNDE